MKFRCDRHADTSELEKAIDKLVYQLYGLTEEEIKIVEEFTIETTDPEFSQTGLAVTSKVRVSRIATIERYLITRKLMIPKARSPMFAINLL